ncbi:ABC transporter substrate-binding protein [Alphaproteobacteria bacterium]|jgi:ribose transport system substrate-binding protein|nr:ABC transporter substrate-binding protein [Alphaproteobacteria bacterium]|tara:strand:+ start:2196 stop:3356 length:1161 start_codon:yes stop_codon:yes gene_type:complete
MIWLKKIIAILAVSFVATSSNLNADILDEIPADIRDFVYDPNFMDPNQPLGESAYRNWKSERPKPWTIGYASSYAGNLWRKGVMERLYGDYLPKMKEAGYLEDIVVTQSNLKDAVQIQQMRQLTDQGVDALIVCCSNPVALNPTIDYAYSQGVPTASMTGYLTSEYAISTSVNYALTGYYIAQWLAESIGGEGNVVIIEGIPGASASDSQHQGMLDGFAQYPDINIVAEIAGMWTPQVAQAELQKWLSANTTQVDGFAVQSSGESGALNALESSGREMVPMALGGEIGSFCYWRNNPDFIDRAIYAWPPGDDAEFAMNVLLRTMEGQGLKIQSVLVPPYEEDVETIQSFVPEDCDRNSSEFRNIGIENWASDEYLNNFFDRGAALL